LRYTFLILDTYHLDILCLFEQGCKDPWLFFEAERGLQAKKVWETLNSPLNEQPGCIKVKAGVTVHS
jgi:hypothetical protein